MCLFSQAASHNRALIYLMTQQLKCKAEDILDFELCLADVQPAVRNILSLSFSPYLHSLVSLFLSLSLIPQTIGGAMQEFIFAPRIDNLMNCYGGLQVLIKMI